MPSSSLLPSFEVPQQDIWGFLFERKDKPYPDDQVLLTDPYTSRSYTYKQTRDAAIEFGKGLKSVFEWRKGDVLALYTPNTIDVPPVMWGCFWAGGIVSPANPNYTAGELAYQLKDSGARAIGTQLPFLDTARAAAKEVGIPDDMIFLLGDQKDPDYKWKPFSSIRNLAGTSRYRRSKADAKKDLAFLPYSSGTTGKPKGVKLVHSNITSNVLMNQTLESQYMSATGGYDGKGDRVLAFLPFFHIYGLTVLIHQAFYAGYNLIVMPKFEIEQFCRLVQEFKPTFSYVVPPVVLQLAKHPVVDKYDMSSLKMMNSGAAPLTADLVNALYKRNGLRVKQGYGLSETSPTTHMQPWDRWQSSVGSCGMLLPNQTAKFMSEDEKELPVGEIGELWLKGPNVFVGYLNNEEGTKNALTEDGYFKTGDVGYQDKDGNFYITDRVKELIKYKGFQVPPAELEGKLMAHPQINDCAVIGIYNKDQATEVPRAYIVLKEGEAADSKNAQEIEKWMTNQVAPHKRLRGGIRFVKEIPKSVSGKILRRMLKDQAIKEDAEPKAKL